MDWKFSGGTFRGSTSSLLFIVSAGVSVSVSAALVADVSVSAALAADVSVSTALVTGVSMSSVSVGVSADHLHTASTH